MPRTRRWIALGLLLAAPVLLAQSAAPVPAPVAAPATTPATAPTATPPTTRYHKSHKPQKQLVLPPLPSGPLSQLPMDQIPPTPAKVSYQGGLLTISAENASLGEILRDVRKLTGASIEIPPGSAAANERVVTHLGPGTPRDVLVGLLNGSSFNYVMLGSSSDPAAITTVILTANPSSSGATQTAANVSNPGATPPNRVPQPQPSNQQLIAPQPGNGQPANAEADDSKDDDDSAADDQAQPAQPDANAQNQQQQADPNQPNAGPKTPEQILDMLQRQRQQQPGAVVPPPQPPQQ